MACTPQLLRHEMITFCCRPGLFLSVMAAPITLRCPPFILRTPTPLLKPSIIPAPVPLLTSSSPPPPTGAWAVVTPASFAYIAGIVGVVAYAVATGIPILMIAFFGERITSGMPHVFSLSDFVGWRFGPIAKTLVAVIALFNM